MNDLYPIKFIPVFIEKIWGGSKINKTLKYKDAPETNCGEAWLLSGFDGNNSVVSNGFLKGNDICELIDIYMDDLVGEKNFSNFSTYFPLLIKAIDAREWLSVQVHPDDEYIENNPEAKSKTEMWYFAETDENSQIISGFKNKIDAEKLSNLINTNKLERELKYHKVSNGDIAFIPSGTVHAIGENNLLFEIQQASNDTFRLYDYGRTDENGKQRELHVDKAVKTSNLGDSGFFIKKTNEIKNEEAVVVNSNYFTTRYNNFGTKIVKDYSEIDSFVIILNVGADFKIECNNHIEEVRFGELVLIPAILKQVKFDTKNENLSFLEIYN